MPAGGSSITAVTPSSFSAAMHASQRTGRVTCATSRLSASAPVPTVVPSALDSSGSTGSAVATPSAWLRIASSAGAMKRVWNAPATGSGITRAFVRRLRGQLLQRGDRTGGDDLARAVAVGGIEPEPLEHGEHVVGIAAEHGAHAGGFQRARGGHLTATDRRELDGGVRAQHARDRGGGQLADRVAGDR